MMWIRTLPEGKCSLGTEFKMGRLLFHLSFTVRTVSLQGIILVERLPFLV